MASKLENMPKIQQVDVRKNDGSNNKLFMSVQLQNPMPLKEMVVIKPETAPITSSYVTPNRMRYQRNNRYHKRNVHSFSAF